ncbi:HAD-IIIC family phosphatase [Muricoccus pecuniae]|uniref:FkbH-like protein n=1 Tax=Muricoccus pecuniae TaxID=693023 RepID=A0A840XZP5_9PROT|nr:HAD-IIIC family phosphatase [Roseomonas pecuniae]MBB5693935.1 FkbH-like protein [Roseomonas pecuniae]
MEQLAWLPAHPDLAVAITAARREADPSAALVKAVRLAGYRRDFTATGRIDKLAARALSEGAEPAAAGLMPYRLAILASHTVDHLAPGIRVAGLARRLALSVHVAPYGQYRQALLGHDPELEAFQPQMVLLALDARDAPLNLPLEASEEAVAEAVRGRVEELRTLWRRARQRFAAQVVQQTLVAADPPVFGSFEGLVAASPTAIVERLNVAIRAAAREEGVLLLDLAWVAARHGQGIGLADPVRWHQAKQLVSHVLAPFYGDLVARIAGAAAGLSRKCLVLDLDNTLWGGVIGDDGIEGIKLGQGSATGEAFLSFQRYAALLGKRGVILAVCSKNDLAVAEAAFTNHPEMALRRADIACFVANWTDKASNLRHIAKTLNIGLDSLVFVDDNPAERDIIRRELPEVGVPELPEDVAGYAERVADAGYFETVSFTADDAARGRAYALNEERRAALEQASDMDGYLRGLGMVMTARSIGAGDLPRATQLINKTNQFNLTTRRYTEAAVEELATNPEALALSVRLSDKFGDNGLISVILARPDPALPRGELLIDTWLMSCRVLGRQVEQATLGVLIEEARRRGIEALVGEYRPSGRNSMVAEHYARLGFTPCASPEGAQPDALFWRLEIGTATVPAHFIQVETSIEQAVMS